jgi:glucose/arabinose dehydrogenase
LELRNTGVLQWRAGLKARATFGAAMSHTFTRRVPALLSFALLLALPGIAAAQLRAEIYVSGLVHPLAFVQDPSNRSVQYVVQQEGVIRVVRNGALQAQPFLDLSGSISMGGERGLLGLAFPADYGTTGRFYVDFTNPDGASVVARFRRASTDPIVADATSRFDLRWSNGLRVIPQPFANHNGGNLVFGPDGYLYIGKGDGGGANNPSHSAQDPTSLLGKMLRIDVNVPDSDANGFRIPPDNPFSSSSVPEIWDFGLRNPWRFTFDNPALGGTGALIIGDVGQNALEEIDYEPAGRGGRNYGWRNREGTNDNITTLPPAFLPLTDPIHVYGRTVGRSITGGYVYRGSALGAGYRGRYFFADFITGRVWSLNLTIDPQSGEATASDLIDHTADLGGSPLVASLSTFGVDAAGELYLANHTAGTILRIRPDVEQDGVVRIDSPAYGATVREPFLMVGTALDPDAAGNTGVSEVQVIAFPFAGGSPLALGLAAYGLSSPQAAASYGPQFANAGFSILPTGLTPGRYFIVAAPRLISTGQFGPFDFVDITVVGGGVAVIESPAGSTTVDRPFTISGFALDGAAAAGTGVDSVLAAALPVGGGTPVFIGTATYGSSRPDVAAVLGSRFLPSGYSLTATMPGPGTWDIVVAARSTVTGTYEAFDIVRVTVR